MAQAIAIPQKSPLKVIETLIPPQAGSLVNFTEPELILMRDMYCKKASAEQFALFLRTCYRTGLDPFLRQICGVLRFCKGKNNEPGHYEMAIQITIDGLRLLAIRGGAYRGTTRAYWCGPNGQWTDAWVDSSAPRGAMVGVYRADCAEPIWAYARFESYWASYDGKASGLWKTMPEVMIAKCAEALALRKACPYEASGVYAEEELNQDEWERVDLPDRPEATVKAERPAPKRVTVSEPVQAAPVTVVEPEAPPVAQAAPAPAKEAAAPVQGEILPDAPEEKKAKPSAAKPAKPPAMNAEERAKHKWLVTNLNKMAKIVWPTDTAKFASAEFGVDDPALATIGQLSTWCDEMAYKYESKLLAAEVY